MITLADWLPVDAGEPCDQCIQKYFGKLQLAVYGGSFKHFMADLEGRHIAPGLDAGGAWSL